MPRVVDPDTRRHDLADAVWRVIRRDGLEGASVRAVAAEAGLSMGSLRHYFVSQSELHTFAMRLVMDGIRDRVRALGPAAGAQRVLEEFLPLDELRRAESQVWLAFTVRALVDPALRALRDEAFDAFQDVCRQLVTGLVPARDVGVEAERLNALVDGLLLHGVVRPAKAHGDLLRAVLRRHLDALGATDSGT